MQLPGMKKTCGLDDCQADFTKATLRATVIRALNAVPLVEVRFHGSIFSSISLLAHIRILVILYFYIYIYSCTNFHIRVTKTFNNNTFTNFTESFCKHVGFLRSTRNIRSR